MVVQTRSAQVERAPLLLRELNVATCPQSKTIQDLASRYGVRKVRLSPEFEDCIQCGKCVRMCAEQMMAGVIGLYSYYQRVAQGLRHLMCGARKFGLEYISRSDIAALTPRAAKITGIPLVSDVDREEVERISSSC